jgi:hypothetical protein
VRARMPQWAVSEWQFTQLHPHVEPWFHRKFSAAAAVPPRRGRAARLARFVPRRVPVIGRYVWGQAGVYWCQQVAPDFLAAWDEAAAGERRADQPDVSALLADSSDGS